MKLSQKQINILANAIAVIFVICFPFWLLAVAGVAHSVYIVSISVSAILVAVIAFYAYKFHQAMKEEKIKNNEE